MSSSNFSLKTRREFLRTTVLGGAFSWTIPAFLARTFAEFEVQAANTTGCGHVCIVPVRMQEA